MSFAPTSLEGRHVKLALMGLHHVDALWAAAQDPKTWEFSSAVIRSVDECRSYVETAVSWMSAGTAALASGPMSAIALAAAVCMSGVPCSKAPIRSAIVSGSEGVISSNATRAQYEAAP